VSVSKRRVRAIFRKELREYRRNGFIVVTMAVIPLIFLIQPLVVVFALPASSAAELSHEHLLLYMLGIPAIVPASVAAYAVVGERQQGTLEPVLTTPILREEFLFGQGAGSARPVGCDRVCGLRPVPGLRRALRTSGCGVGAHPRSGSARPAALHTAPCRLVDLGRDWDLRPIGLALGLTAALLLLVGLGWRIMSATFDRERLMTGTR
jgi:hypothetical protein